MKRFSFTENDLRRAAGQVRGALTVSLPEPRECDHAFSEEFEEKMRPIIKRAEQRSKSRTALKWIAAVIIAALVCIGMWLTIDVEARADVLAWIRDTYENIVTYHFTARSNESDTLPEYKLTWIPYGFERDVYIETPTKHREVFLNSDGNMISFTCKIMNSGTQIIIMDDDEENEMICEKVCVNNLNGDFYYGTEGSPGNTLVLIDEKNNIIIVILSDLDKSIIFEMAEKIKMKQ